MRLLVLIAFLFACFPIYANGNHEKNSHKTPAPVSPPATDSGGHKHRTAYLILGAVGVYAVWTWGKKNNNEGVKIGVKVKEAE